MKAEKIIFSFIAVLIGILVTGLAFYLYQTTKVISPSKTNTVSLTKPSPSPTSSIFLSVESPKDEDVTDKKTISISGKTAPDATVIISTQSTDQVLTPATNGNFSTTTVLDNDQNKIEITALSPTGEEITVIRTVTFSTENF